MEDENDPRWALLKTLREKADDEAVEKLDVGYLRAAVVTVEKWGNWWGAGTPVSVPACLETKFRMVYPLATHALNNVTVALDLRLRLPWVAAGLARIAFEHAVTAQWVLLTHDGEHMLLDNLENEAHKRASEFHKGLGSPNDYAAMVGDKPPVTNWSFWNACARFTSSPRLFYDFYRDLGGAVHPSYGTTLAYLNVTAEAQVAGLNAAGAAEANDVIAPALGASALWALDALEELRDERPNVTRLR